MRRRAALVALLVLGAPPGAPARAAPPAPVPAPAAPPAALRDVSALLAPLRERHGLPALAGGIVELDGLTAAGAVGVRRRGSPELVTTADRWHLGSCTKAMTATLCALLAKDGVLSLDTTLGQALPEHAQDPRRMLPAWREVSLAQLLTNRAGVPGDLAADGLWARLWKREGSPAEQRLRLADGVLAKAPVHAPGSAYLYSNAGFALAGMLAERAAKQDYEALLAERLWKPLGITSGGFGAPGTAGVLDQPRGHDPQGQPVEPGPEADNPPSIAPAGTVHMDLADWGRFVALHLKARAGRSTLLPRDLALRLHTPPPGADPAYACGWIAAERAWGGHVLTHSGSNTAWFCVVWMAPEKGFAAVVCTNEAREPAPKACDEAAWALIQDHLAARRAR